MKRLLVSLSLLVVPATAHANPFGAERADAPADAPAPAPDSPPPPPFRKPLAVRFDGDYAPRRLFGLGVTGADMGLALGAQSSHHFAWWGTSRLSLGSTENGLRVWSSRFGAEIEGVYDPLRFGIGLSLLMMGVGRAARDETLISFGGEGRAFARVDCIRNDDFALFLRAGIDAGAEIYGGSFFWGPAIGAGVELGVSGKRPAAWTSGAAQAP